MTLPLIWDVNTIILNVGLMVILIAGLIVEIMGCIYLTRFLYRMFKTQDRRHKLKTKNVKVLSRYKKMLEKTG